MSPVASDKEEAVKLTIPNQSTAYFITEDLRAIIFLAWRVRMPVGRSARSRNTSKPTKHRISP